MTSSVVCFGRTPRPGYPRVAVQCVLSPHPSPLPWGEGEPFSPRRTTQTGLLSTARCALFPLPEGEGQGEGEPRGLASLYRTFPGNVELGESSGKAGGFH